MWKRLIFGLLLAVGFILAWQIFDRIPVKVIGQPAKTGLIQKRLEQPFFENLAATTGLPLDVTYRTLESVGIKDNYQLQLIKSGALDLVSLRSVQNASIEPMLEGIDLPGFTTSFDAARAVVEALSAVLDRRLQERYNAKLLGIWPFGPQVFFCRVGIKSLTDLKGLKIRVGNDNFAGLINSLGAVPVVLPFDDVEVALKKNVIDCAISSASSGLYAGWANHSTHFYPLTTQMGLNGYVISLRLWNRFSRSQQMAIEKAFNKHVESIWVYANTVHEEASSCLTGGACDGAHGYSLVKVTPTQKDYQTVRNIFEKVTYKEWADRCDRVYPGCADDWRLRMESLLYGANPEVKTQQTP